MALKDIDDVIADYSGRARAVLEYSQAIKSLVDEAKSPDFSEKNFARLARLVDTADFERIGPFKDKMNWDEYVKFLTDWASGSEWECSLRRLSESPDLTFLELEERLKMGDFTNSVNSMSVYGFNAAGKIRRIQLYLQMELPPGGVPTG